MHPASDCSLKCIGHVDKRGGPKSFEMYVMVTECLGFVLCGSWRLVYDSKFWKLGIRDIIVTAPENEHWEFQRDYHDKLTIDAID